jgi:hypothetical protein
MSFRRRQGRNLAAVLAISALGALGFALATSSARATGASAGLGVYRGAATPAQVSAFGTWLGQAPTYAVDYFASDSWTTIESPGWWLDGWAGSPYEVVYSVPLIPQTGGSLQQGASGAYDSHFVTLAQTLVSHGDGNAVLRLGWEFNGSWYRWAAASDPAAFVAYWRHIVKSMRSVAPNLRFEWSPTLGAAQMASTGVEAAYPGDAYVDFVGMDVYDQAWGPNGSIVSDPATRWNMYLTQQNGLNWLASFAGTHGKPITFPEWGLAVRSDGHGGGDNSYFIQHMYDWMTSHNVAYQMYFEFDASDGYHRLMTGQFPLGAAAYRQLFGTGSGSGTTTSTPTTTTSPTTSTSATTTVPPTTTTTTTPTTTTGGGNPNAPGHNKCPGPRCKTPQ